MRILYVGDSRSIHDLRFLSKLSQKKYEVDVLTMIDDPILVEGVTYHTMPHPRVSYEKFSNPKVWSGWNHDPLIIPKLFDWRRYIRNLIKETNPDVLHGGWIPQHGFISALSGFHPFLLMPWGSDVLILPSQSSMMTRAQYVWTIRRADRITCDAEHVKSEIVRLSGYDPDRIVVFPWGVDQAIFNPAVRGDKVRKALGWEGKEVVISTRSLEPIYGMEYLLRAFFKVVEKRPQARLLVCGGGSLMNDLLAYSKSMGMEEYVHFEGTVRNEDLPQYLAAADFYVSTSLSDGTSLSLLEAISMGLPVVVSDIPSNHEWIKEGVNGILARPKDPDAVCHAILGLLMDGEKRKLYGERNVLLARERANWDNNFKKLESIYQSLTKK